MRLRRIWRVSAGGYTFDGVNPTKCQCNTSAGGCKCGNFEADKQKELERLKGLEAAKRQESKQL